MSGPPVQFFLPDFFHLLHENTEGMLKGFDSKLDEKEDPLSDRHTLQNSDKSLPLNSAWNPSWCLAATQVTGCFVLWKNITIIEDKRKRFYKYRTYVYRESCDAPIHIHLGSTVLENHIEPCSKTMPGIRCREVPGLLRNVVIKLSRKATAAHAKHLRHSKVSHGSWSLSVFLTVLRLPSWDYTLLQLCLAFLGSSGLKYRSSACVASTYPLSQSLIPLYFFFPQENMATVKENITYK